MKEPICPLCKKKLLKINMRFNKIGECQDCKEEFYPAPGGNGLLTKRAYKELEDAFSAGE